MPRKAKRILRSHTKSSLKRNPTSPIGLQGSRKLRVAEKVMVVSRRDMFSFGGWHGIKTDNLNKYINLISKKHKFLERSKAENDPSWQQIIPYLIFENRDKYFVMQRHGGHTDRRLANKFSIGIGGHVNKEDVKDNLILNWAKREFEEEVDYQGNYKAEFLGLINDDSNDVGLVHVGLVIKILGDSNDIKIRDEHKLGVLEALPKIGKHYKSMETWSQIVYDYLKEKEMQIVKESRRGKRLPAFAKKLRKGDDFVIGILPDWVIAEYVAKNRIRISPLSRNWRESIDQVSIDFHLGNKLKLFRAGAYRFIDTKRGLPDDAMEEVELKDGDPFILEPGAFAITSTKELLKLPNDILGRLEGKSSLARLGILVHSTAARFDPGWNGAPVLELGNLGPKPAILYCGMPICAFTFEKLASAVRTKYEGSRSDRYSGSKIPVASRIEKHKK